MKEGRKEGRIRKERTSELMKRKAKVKIYEGLGIKWLLTELK